ncbi:hypothetical protein VTN31DRAFT_354 [Thermomyces dupontii]|uniref:uncharacterized protein n=1 Tax=Talaromyces thermophilus TaxID=28565 RepID=UPI003743B160
MSPLSARVVQPGTCFLPIKVKNHLSTALQTQVPEGLHLVESVDCRPICTSLAAAHLLPMPKDPARSHY